ncbi:MAG TPA: NUDIX hydrolase [Acidobacteriaceae bacterium]|jgi:ADP-ribose pyrophosphatase
MAKKTTSATPSLAVPPKSSKALSPAAAKPKRLKGKAKVLSSETVYKGKVFWVTADQVEEPGGVTARRDVVRHNGSVVVLAVDTRTNPKDPGILLIRQYRHAADQFLLELPAGRIEPGEKLIPAAKRELIEETGYRAKRWSHHVKYFASPGFVSEAMNILIAEDLTLGEATPEEDERIELYMTPLSEVIRMIHQDKIHDGKTLIGVLFYESLRKKASKKR